VEGPDRAALPSPPPQPVVVTVMDVDQADALHHEAPERRASRTMAAERT
jgi:hypothetical protein